MNPMLAPICLHWVCRSGIGVQVVNTFIAIGQDAVQAIQPVGAAQVSEDGGLAVLQRYQYVGLCANHGLMMFADAKVGVFFG